VKPCQFTVQSAWSPTLLASVALFFHYCVVTNLPPCDHPSNQLTNYTSTMGEGTSMLIKVSGDTCHSSPTNLWIWAIMPGRGSVQCRRNFSSNQ